jgi:hypothetical protein
MPADIAATTRTATIAGAVRDVLIVQYRSQGDADGAAGAAKGAN